MGCDHRRMTHLGGMGRRFLKLGLTQAKPLVLDSFGFLILQDKMNIVKFQQVSFFAA